MMAVSRRPEGVKWQQLEDVLAAMAEALTDFTTAPRIAPPAGFRDGRHEDTAPNFPVQRPDGDRSEHVDP